MDHMDAHRKKRLEQLLNAEPYNGDRAKFMAKTGYSTGRVAQLLDPEIGFGELAGVNLAKRLGLVDERYFDKGGLATAASWPFVNITPAQYNSISPEVRKAAEAVLLSALPSGGAKTTQNPADQSKKFG